MDWEPVESVGVLCYYAAKSIVRMVRHSGYTKDGPRKMIFAYRFFMELEEEREVCVCVDSELVTVHASLLRFKRASASS